MNLILILCAFTFLSAIKATGTKASPLDQAIAEHCSSNICPPADHTVAIHADLLGTGFHRTISYKIKVQSPPLPPPSTHRRLAILQPLPPAIYANIYELDAAAESGNGPRVKLYGPIDVESIEKYAQPTALAVYIDLDSTAREDEVHIKVPLHARYPRPHRASPLPSTLFNILNPSRMKGVREVIQLSPPTPLLLFSTEVGGDGYAWPTPQNTSNTAYRIEWDVPAGNVELQTFVVVVTSLVVASAAVMILTAVFAPLKTVPGAKQWHTKKHD